MKPLDREFDSTNGYAVQRGCSDQAERVLPNHKISQGYGQCDYGSVNEQSNPSSEDDYNLDTL